MVKVNRVVTFYSYKGGVGRSMAMANIGVILAQWGYRTLIIDWDLEAPGLENYYKDYINVDEAVKKKGLIDLLNLKLYNSSVNVAEINWNEYLNNISINNNSNLDLITAGRRDENYIQNIRKFDFTAFYSEADGGQYLEDLRDKWLEDYNFILIDSRTGLTDSSGICSIHMPDILVLLFTLNEQSFHGIKDVAKKAIEGQKQVMYDRFRLRTLPIPSRIENAETILLDQWMQKINSESADMLEWLPKMADNMKEYLIAPSQLINQIKIPYKTLYAFGERLAVIDRGTTDPQDIGYVYETIAAILANDLQNVHLLSNSRDNLIKKAKGEEITDYSELQRKVEYQQDEKVKLEEQLRVKEEQEKNLKARFKKRRSLIITYSFISAILIASVIYFFLPKNNVVPNPVNINGVDSVDQSYAYKDFATDFYQAKDPSDVAFNIEMNKRFYALDKNYQDSLSSIKNSISTVILDSISKLLHSYYSSLKSKSFQSKNYLDSLATFGNFINPTAINIQKRIDSISKVNTISNTLIDSTLTMESSPEGFSVTYIEKGNVLLDKSEVYKSIKNLVTVVFNNNLNIKSFTYTTLEKGVQISMNNDKISIELFYCNTVGADYLKASNKITSALKTGDKYNVITRLNFKCSYDTSSPYYVPVNQIRYNGQSERRVANTIQSLIEKYANLHCEIKEARTPTPNYISVFFKDIQTKAAY